MSEKPILFNTEMVRAILDGRKTVTRRVCKGQPQDWTTSPKAIGYKAPYEAGDILWVRERFAVDDEGQYHYYADTNYIEPLSWKPSIHMPREAARIFLRVTGVRCERLQDITNEDAKAEGVTCATDNSGMMHRRKFRMLWDSITPPENKWDANPWVWVIEFERVRRDE